MDSIGRISTYYGICVNYQPLRLIPIKGLIDQQLGQVYQCANLLGSSGCYKCVNFLTTKEEKNMSADNGVYVLETIRTRKMEGNASVKCEPYKIWRVAYATAIDNFEWYKVNQHYNLGTYMMEIWGKSDVFEDKDKAYLAAHNIAEGIENLEYGVSVIKTDMVFYGDM